MSKMERQPGFLRLRITWDKGESELRVRCYEARGLKNTILYVKAYLKPDPNRKSKQKTKACKKKTANPKWSHSLMTFPLTNLPVRMVLALVSEASIGGGDGDGIYNISALPTVFGAVVCQSKLRCTHYTPHLSSCRAAASTLAAPPSSAARL